MAEFHVVIEGLELDDDMTRAINDDIQKVVLGHLADHNMTSKGLERGLVAFRPHPDWWGLIAEILGQGDLMQLPQIKDVSGRFGG